jgi:hypothetical protein
MHPLKEETHLSTLAGMIGRSIIGKRRFFMRVLAR